MQLHKPVLLKDVIENLEINPEGIYVDLTLGYAGHSSEILKKLSSKGKLIGFDQDSFAIEKSRQRLSQISDNFVLINDNFVNFKVYLDKMNISFVDGFLLDLGVSSVQLDFAHRGFSYSKLGPLDMRMNLDQPLKADDIVNGYDQESLCKIFIENADVKLAKQVAKGIVNNRPIKDTLELVEVIRSSLPAALVRKKNPAKAVFQAIRIAVNDELIVLKKFLAQSLDFLKKDSKMLIITFHSIEDRIVKDFFKRQVKNKHDRRLPIMEQKDYQVKTIKPTEEEIAQNRRAKSSKLRIIKKL
ncbi:METHYLTRANSFERASE [Mycoplasmopsis pulmonis]|jgi:16S rRNA (cytosine1402-N4)-methyltransferase|uniref:Ribosomal RNA small subunit methyltransferase H n=1 Tax=Mycoplasmopsis pulmonis (strain UAB CTIP) TaxID=272635 RepID=RSMH_MYCPU|nr:16S rRNA (cytosine(1402)-N(4))-methyltransferase RsmH [Mycoplasmopsis pulmonis]Q98Q75.1 RecName: Full=Ribosomal RNA small subunit methyltransferase H; AltName: Full=16S rRNA m(4)C1402 methyltransferase; AltName: Full=rRNA (cytosine-N(4)-)-methyltransferase RsmH [Mycoplasmopsis pulmonis UAB CTIP]MDZ7293497.1 16S rRNA (cytosine(1402)-N(4))-methyltransferase RsmH [Mycoplasmopsis pulmonis]CAC13666.1 METHYLTRANSFERASE [Mycoplasmopsis pulmonis]VEU68260.1 methyltransferase [Mycoplasmopsis pulmonis]